MTTLVDTTGILLPGGVMVIPEELPPGVTHVRTRITPEMATRLLDGNDGNRRLDEMVAATYARMMAAGEWPYVGDPIRLDVDGLLLDGQHRLKAVELCGTPLLVDLFAGLPRETRANMDAGKARVAGGLLSMEGVQSAATCAAIARLLLVWGYPEGRWTLAKTNYKPGQAEIVGFVRQHAPHLEDAARVAAAVRVATGMKPSVGGAVYFRANELNVWRAAEFFEAVRSGAMVEENNPVMVLRRRLARRIGISSEGRLRRDTQPEQLLAVVKAWNLWVDRRTAVSNNLALPPGGVTPSVVMELNDGLAMPDEPWTPRP